MRTYISGAACALALAMAAACAAEPSAPSGNEADVLEARVLGVKRCQSRGAECYCHPDDPDTRSPCKFNTQSNQCYCDDKTPCRPSGEDPTVCVADE